MPRRGSSALGTGRVPYVANPDLDDWVQRQCEREDAERTAAWLLRIDAEIAVLTPIVQTIDRRANRSYSSENVKKYNALLVLRKNHLSAALDITSNRVECRVCTRFHVTLGGRSAHR